jgi:hypothetical protein
MAPSTNGRSFLTVYCISELAYIAIYKGFRFQIGVLIGSRSIWPLAVHCVGGLQLGALASVSAASFFVNQSTLHPQTIRSEPCHTTASYLQIQKP